MNSLKDGLVAEFLFDGNALDTSGYGNHGKSAGVVPTANRFNEPNRAFAFSGTGDCVVLDPPPILNPEAFSLSVWVKYDEAALMDWWNNAIISQDDHGRQADKARRVFQLSAMGDNVRMHLMMRAPDVTAKNPVQRGVWYHFATAFDGTHYKLFMNGELQDIKQGIFQPNLEEPIFIGKKNSEEPRFYFHGALDDIRIYNRALSELEVMELYTEQGYAGNPEIQLRQTGQAETEQVISTKSNVLAKPL